MGVIIKQNIKYLLFLAIIAASCKKDEPAPPFIYVLSTHSVSIEVIKAQSESGTNSTTSTGAAANVKTWVAVGKGSVVKMVSKTNDRFNQDCYLQVFDNHERKIYSSGGATHQLAF